MTRSLAVPGRASACLAVPGRALSGKVLFFDPSLRGQGSASSSSFQFTTLAFAPGNLKKTSQKKSCHFVPTFIHSARTRNRIDRHRNTTNLRFEVRTFHQWNLEDCAMVRILRFFVPRASKVSIFQSFTKTTTRHYEARSTPHPYLKPAVNRQPGHRRGDSASLFASKLAAGGRSSTWSPPGRLVELSK